MAINSYDSKSISVGGGSLLSTRADNLPDARYIPTNLGTKLLAAFEPQMREAAQKSAVEAAASTPIVRTPEGGYEPMVIPDGGTEFQSTFENALRTKYANEMYFDFQVKADEIAAQNSRDPDRAKAQMIGLRDAMLKNLDPVTRTEVEPILNRETVQRYGGIISRTAEEDRRLVVNGLNSQIDALINETSVRVKAGDQQGALLAKARLNDTVRKLASIGGLAPEGEEAIQTELGVAVSRAQDAAKDERRQERALALAEAEQNSINVSIDNVTRISSSLFGMDDGSLLTLRLWTKGVPNGQTIKLNDGTELTFEDFQQQIPSDRVMSRFEGSVEQTLNVRQNQRRAQAEITERNELIQSVETIASFGTIPNYSNKQREIVDQIYNDGRQGKPFNFGDPNDRAEALGFTAKYKTIPRPMMDAITTGVFRFASGAGNESDLRLSIELYDNLKNLEIQDPKNANGTVQIGGILVSEIEEKTRKALDAGLILSRQRGLPPDVLSRTVVGIYNGTLPELPYIPNYQSQRAQAINKAVDLDRGSSIPSNIAGEFDATFRAFASVVDIPRAMEMAAESIGSRFKSDRRFLNSFGDVRFDQLVPTESFKDYMIKQLGEDFDPSGRNYKIAIDRDGVVPTYRIGVLDEYGNPSRTVILDPRELRTFAPQPQPSVSPTGNAVLTPEQQAAGEAARERDRIRGEAIMQGVLQGGM